jgi:hypothetical protein
MNDTTAALMVLVLDEKQRKHLEATNPKALMQALRALSEDADVPGDAKSRFRLMRRNLSEARLPVTDPGLRLPDATKSALVRIADETMNDAHETLTLAQKALWAAEQAVSHARANHAMLKSLVSAAAEEEKKA